MIEPGDLKFKENGLIPAVAQDAETGEILMLAYMNREALDKTLQTGKAWYWSRSRQELWLKGDTSGHYQLVKEIRTDCDQDTLLLVVEQLGAGACHEGYKSCFHYYVRGEDLDEMAEVLPKTDEETKPHDKAFDPTTVYKEESSRILTELYEIIKDRKANPVEDSYTTYLFDKGLDKILKKVGEETAEVIIGAKNAGTDELVYEAADLMYHLLVLLAEKGAKPEDIYRELRSRR